MAVPSTRRFFRRCFVPVETLPEFRLPETQQLSGVSEIATLLKISSFETVHSASYGSKYIILREVPDPFSYREYMIPTESSQFCTVRPGKDRLKMADKFLIVRISEFGIILFMEDCIKKLYFNLSGTERSNNGF